MYQLRYSNFDSYFNSFISQMYLLIWLSFHMLSLNIMKSHIKYTKNLENIDFGPYITVNLCLVIYFGFQQYLGLLTV